MENELRHWIRLVEGETPASIARKKRQWLPSLIRVMDSRSVATILEMSYDTDDAELADAWFQNCMAIYKSLGQPSITVYRHMKVQNFAAFLQSLEDGSGHLGQYWSVDYSIESPTWKQDHKGNIPVRVEGTVATKQVDWSATLLQNFEWPHESELIFAGDVFVRQIENMDDDTSVKPNKVYPR